MRFSSLLGIYRLLHHSNILLPKADEEVLGAFLVLPAVDVDEVPGKFDRQSVLKLHPGIIYECDFNVSRTHASSQSRERTRPRISSKLSSTSKSPLKTFRNSQRSNSLGSRVSFTYNLSSVLFFSLPPSTTTGIPRWDFLCALSVPGSLKMASIIFAVPTL